MSVYGKIKTNVISEQTSRNNQDSYGLSKFKMEQYLKKNSKKYNLNYAIFRLPGVIGYKSNHNFLSEKIKKIRNNEQIKISNPNFLFNNVVHVKNLAIIVSESLRLENEKATYNLGSNNKIKLKFLNLYNISK